MNRTVPLSLEPLAAIAVKQAGAEYCAVYRVDPLTGSRELIFAIGDAVPQEGNESRATDSYPLRADDEITGSVAFVLPETAISPAKRALLERVAGAMEEVWRLSLLPEIYAREAARLGELEFQLADSKIADRARGLIAAGPPLNDPIETIVRHVESVLRPGELRGVLGRLTQETEQEIAERQLASRAKAVLQRKYGMSEDQAHVHLRLVSRKSRKRLRDVARDLLEEEPLLQRGR